MFSEQLLGSFPTMGQDPIKRASELCPLNKPLTVLSGRVAGSTKRKEAAKGECRREVKKAGPRKLGERSILWASFQPHTVVKNRKV